MHKLEWEIKQVIKSNRDGSFATQKARSETFKTIVNQSKDVGFRRITINSLLTEKTISRFVNHWKNDGKSSGTIKNRMSHLRWLGNKKNVASKIPTNQKLGIANRVNISNINKVVCLEPKHLNQITDENIRDSLKHQSLFGVRREESMKTNFVFADRGNQLFLMNRWCKGKVERSIPILTQEQRDFVDKMKDKYGNNSLIPANRTYKEHLQIYKNQVSKSGLGKAHGLRHKYAQDRYKVLTGNNCPVCDGKKQRDMTKEERDIDRKARLKISAELGHKREQITSNYLGS